VLRLHVIEAFPKLAKSPASQITTEQVADVMRRLIQDGKRRSANKLRSYMRAAFQCAKSAKTNPSIPLSFKSFAISINPVSDTTPDPQGNQADKNPINFLDCSGTGSTSIVRTTTAAPCYVFTWQLAVSA
jgi:hypothetical protein